MYAGRDERQVECQCSLTATRLPFSGVPYLKGDTVVSAIPDPQYKFEAERRQFNDTWGPVEKVYEGLHKNTVIDDKTGQKSINTKAMNAL